MHRINVIKRKYCSIYTLHLLHLKRNRVQYFLGNYAICYIRRILVLKQGPGSTNRGNSFSFNIPSYDKRHNRSIFENAISNGELNIKNLQSPKIQIATTSIGKSYECKQ